MTISKWSILLILCTLGLEVVLIMSLVLYGVYDFNKVIKTRADQVTDNINYNVNKTMELMDSINKSMDKSIVILKEKKWL